MALYFITGSEGKFSEAKAILGDIEWLNEDLPEIQEIDARKIISAKMDKAREMRDGEFIVEDTSLYFDCLCGLPGPLIKWFLRALGNEGMWRMVEKMGSTKVEARTLIGYVDAKGEKYFFEGAMQGDVSPPRGDAGIGWDPIFRPDGHERTFGEMTREEKNEISMRRIAFQKLKEFLEK